MIEPTPVSDLDFSSKCPYTIEITYDAYMKLRAYILNAQSEISGLGSIFLNSEKKIIYVWDIFLLDQKVTSAGTVLDSKGIAKFYMERQKANPKDDLGGYKLWWHSHYNFATFWSAIDDGTIESMDQETAEDNWLLSIVGNQRGDLLCRLDVFSPIRMTHNKIPYMVQEVPLELTTNTLAEIKEKVHEEVIPPAPNTWKGYHGKKGRQLYLDGGAGWHRTDDDIFVPNDNPPIDREDDDEAYYNALADSEVTSKQIVARVVARVEADFKDLKKNDIKGVN